MRFDRNFHRNYFVLENRILMQMGPYRWQYRGLNFVTCEPSLTGLNENLSFLPIYIQMITSNHNNSTRKKSLLADDSSSEDDDDAVPGTPPAKRVSCKFAGELHI